MARTALRACAGVAPTELVARLHVAEILEHQDEAVAAIFILAVQQAR